MSGRSSVSTDDEEDDELELEDMFPDDEESDDEDDGETEQADEQDQTVQQTLVQQEDWESRFRGLQGTLQQQVEARRALEGQLLILSAGQRHQQLVANGMDEGVAQAQVRAEVQQALLQMEGNNINTTKQSMEESARILHAQKLAIEHKIPLDSAEFKRMMQFKDPEDMTEAAKLIASAGVKQTRNTKRRKTGADKFGKAAPVSKPSRKPAKSLGEAMDRFVSRRS